MYPLPTPAIEADEERLLPRRAALHALLALPADQPLLRAANAVDFSAAAGAGPGGKAAAGQAHQGQQQAQRLVDVHLGLRPSGVPGGSVHLVRGAYDYYHYTQVRGGAGRPAWCVYDLS